MRRPARPRRPQGPALLELRAEYRRRAGVEDRLRRRHPAWASSPTRRCASAARRARSPARSGTRSPRTAWTSSGCRWTTRARWAPTRGATSRSSSSRCPSRTRRRACAGSCPPTSASTARTPLPGGLPHRLAVPHGVRQRGRAAGHLQRLRLLRPGVPVRRARPARGGRPGLEVHALLRPPRGRQEPACAKACPTNSIQFGPLDDLREHAEHRVIELHERGEETRGCTSTTRRTGSAGRARSSSCSTTRRSTACRPIRSTRRATSARRGARRRAQRPGCWRASPARCSGAGGEPTTAGRSSSGRSGPGRSPSTSSSAASPARAARSRRARG